LKQCTEKRTRGLWAWCLADKWQQMVTWERKPHFEVIHFCHSSILFYTISIYLPAPYWLLEIFFIQSPFGFGSAHSLYGSSMLAVDQTLDRGLFYY
jgi:hypothetical protein